VSDERIYRRCNVLWRRTHDSVLLLVPACGEFITLQASGCDLWAVLDLWHGECRGSRMVSPEEGERCQYVIRAPYSRWKDVLHGDLDPVKGMMQGKLKVRGDLPAIVRQVRAATELVRLTGDVPTAFPDEAR